jgi:hypothetical protein
MLSLLYLNYATSIYIYKSTYTVYPTVYFNLLRYIVLGGSRSRYI